MKTNDRVRSEYNEGTVKSVENGIVTVHWDGFAWPTAVPADLAASFEVVGFVLSEEDEDSGEPFARHSDREDFHSDG
jgi:hypothetical protein